LKETKEHVEISMENKNKMIQQIIEENRDFKRQLLEYEKKFK
jgi:hypothetical protein